MQDGENFDLKIQSHMLLLGSTQNKFFFKKKLPHVIFAMAKTMLNPMSNLPFGTKTVEPYITLQYKVSS